MSQVGFLPWIGKNYNKSNPRILILGESHYGDDKDYCNTFTKWVIETYAIDPKNRRRFFTTILKTVTGNFGWIDDKQREEFWESVVFYNYVQEFVGGTARIRPSEKMWLHAKESFFTTLTHQEPQIVIVLGKKLGEYVREVLKEKLFPETHFCYWAHPAAPKYFKRTEYFQEIQEVKSRFQQ